jgi:hypothetical protein
MSEAKKSKMLVDEFNVPIGADYASDLAARSLKLQLLGDEVEINAFIGRRHPKGIAGYIRPYSSQAPSIEAMHHWLAELLQHAIDTAAHHPTLVSSSEAVRAIQGAHLDTELALEGAREELVQLQAKVRELEDTRHKAFLQGSRSGKQAILDKLRAEHDALEQKREELVSALKAHEQGLVATGRQLRAVDADVGQAKYVLLAVENLAGSTNDGPQQLPPHHLRRRRHLASVHHSWATVPQHLRAVGASAGGGGEAEG